MARTLVLKPSSRTNARPWVLVLRNHDLSGTDYEPIAYLDNATAYEVVEAGAVTWLYGEPKIEPQLS